MSVPPGAMGMGPQAQPRLAEEGEWLELPLGDEMDFEDTADGGADIKLENKSTTEPVTNDEFYDNLADELPMSYMMGLAMDLLEKVEIDKQSREKRDKQYQEGLRRTGIGGDAPGGADFEGASKAVHPMLTKAAVEFEARAMKEVFPAKGPSKAFIPGKITKERQAKADRQTRYMNWLMTTQMEEFRPALEQTLTQSALAGVQYLRFRWDDRLKRPTTQVIPVDKLFLPYDAASLWSAERATFEDDITELEYKKRVRDGIYTDADLVAPSMAPDPSKAQQARNKAEGKETDPYNIDGVRRTYEVAVLLDDVEAACGSRAQGPTDMALPYIVYLDESTHQVLGIQRNWEKDDDKMQKMQWIVDWGFIPWVGAVPIGFVHMIGSLSGSATGTMRALLDAGHIGNYQTAFALKGSNVSGQTQQSKPTQINYIKGGVGADDIRKQLMPVIPVQPSATLFQLLGFLVDAGEQMVRTTFENLSENNPNAPVGTTYALIEQGLAVVSAIIGRMHYSMYHVLRVLHRIARMYVTDEQIQDEAGEMLAFRKDFEGPCDVIPVSDPGIPSDAHRFAQMQVVAQRADLKPQLYNQRHVEKMVLERLRVQDPDAFLVPIAEPLEMNAANENAALVFAKPIVAFPQQDHLAHLQVHIDFISNPLFGALPIIAPAVIPPMLQHISQHIALWYLGRIYQNIAVNLEGPLDDYMQLTDNNVKREIDQTIAASSKKVIQDAQGALGTMNVPQVIQQAQALMKQLTPPPQDPRAAADLQRTQIQEAGKDKDRQARSSDKQADITARTQDKTMELGDNDKQRQADGAMEAGRQQSETDRASSGDSAKEAIAAYQQQMEGARLEQSDNTKAEIAAGNNQTAKDISEGEIEAGKHSALSDGEGIGRE